MKPIRLRTEYLLNPLGIDTPTPRLFWNACEGIRQTAYQIRCTDADGNLVWDSGKVAGASMHADYAGRALKSRDRITWSLCLWDENDTEGPWEEAFFELGLLDASDWTAQWIAGDYAPRKNLRYPVDCFRKEFVLGKTVKTARLYITACGLYEACLDGVKIGDGVMTPGYTDYRKRVQYQTYDVTEMLQEGGHCLTVELADGWYRGSVGAHGLRNAYGTQTKLLAQLEVRFADGSGQRIATDGTWEWNNDGPVRFADNKDGEVVEASRIPSYSAKVRVTSHAIVPSASDNVPVTSKETFKPQVITTPAGKTVLDFGQNIAGQFAFSLKAKEGQRIFLRFGEALDAAGEFTQKNIQCTDRNGTSPLQQIEYICKEGTNDYRLRFAMFGYRYVLVETDIPFKPEDFTAIAVYSDLEETIRFDSSNPLLNRFVDCTRWSLKNNHADIPTDCPTRERHGWTGDAQIFCRTAAYLTQYAPFARKYMNDLKDWQAADPKGRFPQIAPEGGTDPYMAPMNGSVGWADAGVFIPWQIWQITRDERILSENYEAMTTYAAFMKTRIGKKGLLAKQVRMDPKKRRYLVNDGQSYGEWLEPADVHPMSWTDTVFPHPEESTAYTIAVMDVMARIADVLGKSRDAEAYRATAANVRLAYQDLVKVKGYTLDTDRMAKLVRPLYFDLLDEKEARYAKKRLITACEHYNWRVGTGFLSTPMILYVLSEIDSEAAYRMLENEENPGWLFMPKAGATTVWEDWTGTATDSPDGAVASLNHYSKGAVLEWVFSEMCGVSVAGENRFAIAPVPGGHFTKASLTWDSPFGAVTCAWEKGEEGYRYQIRIPANATAEVSLPGMEKQILTAGEYRF